MERCRRQAKTDPPPSSLDYRLMPTPSPPATGFACGAFQAGRRRSPPPASAAIVDRLTLGGNIIETAPIPTCWPIPWRIGLRSTQPRCSAAARSCEPHGTGAPGSRGGKSALPGQQPQRQARRRKLVVSAVDSGAVPPGEHPPEGAQHGTVAPAVGGAAAPHGAHRFHETSNDREQQIHAQKPCNYPSDHVAFSLSPADNTFLF